MNAARISYLGHELEVGNKVQFTTSGMTLIGTILEFNEKEKAVVKIQGCKYKTSEELEMIQSKVKREYKVNPGKCILLVPANTYNK